MIALAGDWVQGDRSSLFRWIVPASVALHVVAFAWLPSTAPRPASPPPPLVIEAAEPPALPSPPPPPAPEPEPAPAPVRPTAASPPIATNVIRAPREADRVNSTPAPADAPMDFTSTLFSNDGPGMPISGGRSPATAPSAQPARAAPLAPPASARIVPASSLARRPRAPGLDTELERQYPVEARRSGISGSAVLRVRILPDGRIGEVHVVSESRTGFGPACERTVRAARWEPPIDREGAPVTTEISYTCRFEVRS